MPELKMSLEPKTILVADDEPSLRRVLCGVIERQGHRAVTVSNGQEALSALSHQPVNAIITDLRMPVLDGMALLNHAITDYPDVPVVILTAHGSVDNAVTAVKLGALDYLEKPFEQEQLEQAITLALRTNELRLREVHDSATTGAVGRYGLVGTSAAMQAVYNVIEKVADTPSTVLITGESGTGKELVAKALHEQSQRREGPLIKVNCAAIPDMLIESELFGHERGAFTGAVSSKPGRFELAQGGTIFLDEIGEVPLEMQVKLLRALQDSEFERVGGIKTIKVDVRVVAATNRDLSTAIQQGRFREDLYYRLNVVPVHLPPLRARRDDIPKLVRHILDKFRERLGRSVSDVAPDAMEGLARYSWPGNIRELENVLERTILFCNAEVIRFEDLPSPPRETAPGSEAAPGEARPSGEVELTIAAPPQTLPPPPARLKDVVRAETIRVERQAIMDALVRTAGNVTHAAKELGISRKGLQLKMKELGLREGEINAARQKS